MPHVLLGRLTASIVGPVEAERRHVAIGWLIEHASPLASAFFYVPGVMSLPMATVAGVAWIGFKVWDQGRPAIKKMAPRPCRAALS